MSESAKVQRTCQDGHPWLTYCPEDWPAYRGACPYCEVCRQVLLLRLGQSWQEHEVRDGTR